MAHDTHEKKGHSPAIWIGIGLVLVGMILGAYAADTLAPWINPTKAALIQNTENIQRQNALLKEQIDCLANGINANHGKKTLEECT